VHKHAVLHLRQSRAKAVVEPVRAAEADKLAVAGAEAVRRCTPRQPVRRT
jgi:hypothetical protein